MYLNDPHRINADISRVDPPTHKTPFTPPLSVSLSSLSGSRFVANAAGMGGSGGGIWVEDGATAALTTTELVNNTAASSYTHKGAGGGVAVAASAHLSMADGCKLEGNVAGPEVRCGALRCVAVRCGAHDGCRFVVHAPFYVIEPFIY